MVRRRIIDPSVTQQKETQTGQLKLPVSHTKTPQFNFNNVQSTFKAFEASVNLTKFDRRASQLAKDDNRILSLSYHYAIPP